MVCKLDAQNNQTHLSSEKHHVESRSVSDSVFLGGFWYLHRVMKNILRFFAFVFSSFCNWMPLTDPLPFCLATKAVQFSPCYYLHDLPERLICCWRLPYYIQSSVDSDCNSEDVSSRSDLQGDDENKDDRG